MFDSLKVADMLALNVDLAAEGLDLSGVLAVKPDSDAAKAIANANPGSTADLGKLPADAAFFVYMKLNADVINRLQALGMRTINPEGKPSPEMQKAMDQMRQLGQIENLGAMSMDQGIKGLTVITTSEPKTYIGSTHAMLESMKGGEGPLSVYKDVKTEKAAENLPGLRL